MKRVLLNVMILAVALCSGVALLTSSVYADGSVCDGGLDEDLKDAAGCNEGDKIEDKLSNIFGPVFGIVGIIAVGAVIYGGFLFMKSNGDPGKAATARHVIMYAIVGLIVAVLAAIIVRFVVEKVSK